MNKVCPLCFKIFKKKYSKQKFCNIKCYLAYASLNPNKGCFKKGHISLNKGKTGIHYSPSTEFKKGRKRKDLKPVFSLKRRKHKREKFARNFIKVEQPGKWILYARYLWIKHYGKIIKGDIIWHINGVSSDDRLGNLIAIPRKWNYFLNKGRARLTPERLEYFRSRYKR